MKKSERIATKCKICNKEIEVTKYRFSVGRGKYCSKKCVIGELNKREKRY